jgi:isoquinoline 1-oxidoreductase
VFTNVPTGYGQCVARLIVNGGERTVAAGADLTLLDVLREQLGLTGAKYGCGEGECGACTVLLDGAAVRACQLPGDVDGEVTTVEGLAGTHGRSASSRAEDGALHPVAAAFVAERALQCGYCTPGMVMSTVALLAHDPDPDEAAIRAALQNNICRCGGHPRILAAVRRAAGSHAEVEAPVEAPAGNAEQPGAIGDDGRSASSRAQDDGRSASSRAEDDGRSASSRAEDAWTFTVTLGVADPPRSWGWSTPGGARLRLYGDGAVAYIGKVEAGQGNRAALTRLIAAELALPTTAVRLVMGDTDASPYDFGTVGSRSMPDAGHALRLLAVAARRELLGEAADRWGVAADGLTALGQAVRGEGRELAYRDLVVGARTIEVDPDGPLPGAPEGLAGVDRNRLRADLAVAVTGAKRFPSDLTVPDMAHGRVLRAPSYGAVLRTLDASAAASRPGVTVVHDADLVGVVAPTRAEATAALAQIRAEWDPVDQPDDTEIEGYLRDHPVYPEGRDGVVLREAGDVDAALAEAEVELSATYTTAYVAHVPLEPRIALASVDGDSATVWVGTQRPFAVRDEVALALDLPADRVRIVVPDFGGGFGGKHSGDVAVEAARLARAAGRPVRLAWSREEEFRFAYFRPAAIMDVRCAATADGTLTGWEFVNINAGAAALFTPYQVVNRRERFQPARSPLRQGSYRALAATANHFARESHLDELARAVGTDPVGLRLRLLRDDRLRDVLAALAEHIDWPNCPHRIGAAVGIACGLEKEARVATAAEVTVDDEGLLHVARLTSVVECGAVVDPDGVRIQVVGATVMGLGGALSEAVRVKDGRMSNASMADYRVPRFGDVPPIDVVVLDRPDLPSAGVGETPIVTVAPAIANAIRTATGRRLRSLPLAPDGVVNQA